MHTCSIAVIGTYGVGRANIARRFAKDDYFVGFNGTLVEVFERTIVVVGKEIKVDVEDTSGLDEFDSLLKRTIQ